MDRRAFLVQLGSLCLLSQQASAQRSPWQELQSVDFGDGLTLRIFQAQGSGPVFFVPHNDENVAVQAVEQFWRIVKPMGTLIALQQFDQAGRNLDLRYIYQTFRGKRIYADPNRIYSANLGITANRLELPESRRCGVAFTATPGLLRDKAAIKFRAIGEKMTGTLRQYLSKTDPLIVALHNNTNNALQANGDSFPKQQFELRQQRSPRSQAPQRDLDNFFLTTQRQDYERLSTSGWNSILQLPSAVDDGSLSIWAAKQQIRFINIEAEHVLCNQPSPEQVAVQVQMLQAALGTKL